MSGGHRTEIELGRSIEAGTVLPYLCWSNHLLLVVGPHILCRCSGGARGGRIYQKPADHCPCGMTGYHHHTDGTEGVRRSDSVLIFCNCTASVKGPASFKKEKLRAAATAYIMYGYHGAVSTLLGLGVAAYPPRRESRSYVDLLPDDFPPGR